jgi:NADPH-dependent F420 reductase
MTTRSPDAIAILGGTGDQGLGLALRFAHAGRPVVIGSRKVDRALAAADEVRKAVAGADVVGLENAEATRRAEVVILSVPFEHSAPTVKALEDVLVPGQIVVSMGVPLATAIGDGAVRTVGVWQGSCAELVAELVPDGVEVVSAFQNVSAHRLQELAEPVECDVVVSGEGSARARDRAVLARAGAPRVDGGPPRTRGSSSRSPRADRLNIRYRGRRASVRFTGSRPPLARRASLDFKG